MEARPAIKQQLFSVLTASSMRRDYQLVLLLLCLRTEWSSCYNRVSLCLSFTGCDISKEVIKAGQVPENLEEQYSEQKLPQQREVVFMAEKHGMFCQLPTNPDKVHLKFVIISPDDCFYNLFLENNILFRTWFSFHYCGSFSCFMSQSTKPMKISSSVN